MAERCSDFSVCLVTNEKLRSFSSFKGLVRGTVGNHIFTQKRSLRSKNQQKVPNQQQKQTLSLLQNQSSVHLRVTAQTLNGNDYQEMRRLAVFQVFLADFVIFFVDCAVHRLLQFTVWPQGAVHT